MDIHKTGSKSLYLAIRKEVEWAELNVDINPCSLVNFCQDQGGSSNHKISVKRRSEGG